MTQIKLEDIIRQSAQGGNFEFDDQHMAQALGMIQQRKRRRRLAWIWIPAMFIIVGAGIYMAMAISQSEVEEVESNLTTVQTEPIAEKIVRPEAQTESLNESDEMTAQSSSSFDMSSDESTSSVIPTPTDHPVELEVKNASVTEGSSSQDKASLFNLGRDQKVEQVLNKSTSTFLNRDESTREFYESDFLFGVRQGLLDWERYYELGYLSMEGRPLPWQWKAIVDIQSQIGSNQVQNRFQLGLQTMKPISEKLALGLELSVVASNGSSDPYLLQRVDEYGVEVSSRFYQVQPQWMFNGKLAVLYGLKWHRWSIQAGPNIQFAPMAFGEISEVALEDGQISSSSSIGEGWIDQRNSQSWTYGGQASLLYQVTPRGQWGLNLNYQRQFFYQENQILESMEHGIYLGIRYQYNF